MRLEDKVALITGGARGQGAAEVRLFVREGAKVAIADVLEEEGERLEAEIAELGGSAFFVRLDVTSESDWSNAVATTVARYGSLHILVNNAGSLHERNGGGRRFTRDWDRIMDVNAKGVFLGTKAVIPEMRKAGGGSIVNISSISGMIGQERVQPAYNASKGAVRLLTKSTAVQHAKDGIRVNSVHPGPIRTPMIEDGLIDPEQYADTVAQIPLGRVGDPMDVAYAVLYLSSRRVLIRYRLRACHRRGQHRAITTPSRTVGGTLFAGTERRDQPRSVSNWALEPSSPTISFTSLDAPDRLEVGWRST